MEKCLTKNSFPAINAGVDVIQEGYGFAMVAVTQDLLRNLIASNM